MIGAVAGTLLVGGGVAAAAGIFSSTPDEVERGIPGGSVIVTGTDPTGTTVDGIIFDCMLAHVPTEDISLYADRDFVGAVYDTVDDQSITTGAVGRRIRRDFTGPATSENAPSRRTSSIPGCSASSHPAPESGDRPRPLRSRPVHPPARTGEA